MKQLFIYFLFSSISTSMLHTNLMAQVKSKSFNAALQLLLKSGTPIVTVEEVAKNFDEFLLLDARAYKEYAVSHLLNARFVGDQDFDISLVKHLPKNARIVVYCSIGKRSETVTLQLLRAGYTNVRNLYGGIFEWVNQGYPVFNSNIQQTNQVHAYSRFWGQWLNKGVKVYD